jgi:hypothetical protein
MHKTDEVHKRVHARPASRAIHATNMPFIQLKIGKYLSTGIVGGRNKRSLKVVVICGTRHDSPFTN